MSNADSLLWLHRSPAIRAEPSDILAATGDGQSRGLTIGMLDQSAGVIGRAWAAAVRHGSNLDRTPWSVDLGSYQPPVVRKHFSSCFHATCGLFRHSGMHNGLL